MDKIKLDDFKKIDARIGTVLKAEVPAWSHWVIKLTVDLGNEIGTKIIFTGMLGFYEAKDFEGKQFPFIVNLEPKKIGPEGDISEGMLMAANNNDKPILLKVTKKVPNGTKIM